MAREESDAMTAVMRFLHFAALAIGVGGLFYNTYVLIPEAIRPSGGDPLRVRAGVLGRFRYFAWASIGLFLLSGLWLIMERASVLFNFRLGYAHAMWTKIILALGLFAHVLILTLRVNPAIAAAIERRDPGLDRLVERSRRLHRTAIILAVLVLALVSWAAA